MTGLETLFLSMFDSENQLKPAHLPLECHHGSSPSTCPHNDPEVRYRCPTANEIKYRMTRLAIDALDFYLVESGTTINLWVIFNFYYNNIYSYFYHALYINYNSANCINLY